MLENLNFTENKDYIHSFKSLANKIQLDEINRKENDYEDDEDKAFKRLEVNNILREISLRNYKNH
jgi:hypothetical protein